MSKSSLVPLVNTDFKFCTIILIFSSCFPHKNMHLQKCPSFGVHIILSNNAFLYIKLIAKNFAALTVFMRQINVQRFGFFFDSGTIRTAGMLCSRTGKNHGTPFVSLTAPPPYLFMTPASHHIGFQVPVQGWMPFPGKRWVQRFQVIKSCQYFFARTIGALITAWCSRRDNRLPRMSLFAFPPHFFVAESGYVTGRHRLVFVGIPLACDVWKKRLQVVKPGANLFPGTVWASFPVCPWSDSRFPLMTFFAFPPIAFYGTGKNVLWCNRMALWRVPLKSEQWIFRREIIDSGDNPTILTNGT